VVVPVCSLILAVFLAHAFIGPFGRMIGDGVAFAVRHLMTGSFAPIGAALFGFLYAPLVITGVHQTTLAIDMQMIQSLGGTPVWPIIALSNIAQASAVTGIIIVSRKHNEREISVPAAISAYLGVTEPAMYGINLKYRFPMLCAMIGSGLAGPGVWTERRDGERDWRRRPAGHPLHPARLLAGVCPGDGHRDYRPNGAHHRGLPA
jgi:PTS system trehalose-specific IIC component